jgi:hypothetical protein
MDKAYFDRVSSLTKKTALPKLTNTVSGAIAGAAAGGILGGALGWMAGLGGLEIHGLGAVITVDPIMAAFAGAAAGATMTGLTGALVGFEIPRVAVKLGQRRLNELVPRVSKAMNRLSLLAGYAAAAAFSIYAIFFANALTPVRILLNEPDLSRQNVSGKYLEIFNWDGLMPTLLAVLAVFVLGWCIVRGTAWAVGGQRLAAILPSQTAPRMSSSVRKFPAPFVLVGGAFTEPATVQKSSWEETE